MNQESDPGPIKINKGFQMSCLKWLVRPMMPFFLQMDRHKALTFFHYEAVCFGLQILTRFPVGLWTLYGPFIPPDECLFSLITFHWEGSNGSKEASDLLMSLPSWKSEPLFSRAACGLQAPDDGQAPDFSISVKGPNSIGGVHTFVPLYVRVTCIYVHRKMISYWKKPTVFVNWE